MTELTSPRSAVHRDSLHRQPPGPQFDDDNDSEFSFAVGDPDGTPSVIADDIFSDGRILPVYPHFGRGHLLSTSLSKENHEAAGPDPQGIPIRKLLIEEPSSRWGSISSSSSLEAEDLESSAARDHCPWIPRSAPQSPDRCRKSASTGTERRWRLRDLLSGRSHSDGKDKFLFLDAPPTPQQPLARGKSPRLRTAAAKGGKPRAAVDTVTANRTHYGKKVGNGQAVTAPRRSFLPYRQELLGLFTTRTRHPF
ncbi:uncharacterized protein LOC135589039 [Musa acuminata AAA Group]|uniref:uncharacterized protein LOC135589039 n=1 Tax=Musa acuminata AAA Group TaxID=214697 RepID=UPI0031DE968A